MNWKEGRGTKEGASSLVYTYMTPGNQGSPFVLFKKDCQGLFCDSLLQEKLSISDFTRLHGIEFH